jgi:hypothetical protein
MKFPATCLLVFLVCAINANAQAPNLQTASSFAVLAGSGVTNADAGTTISGSVGSSSTPAVTGLLASQVTNGTLYTVDNAIVDQAKLDLTAAYLDAAGRSGCTPISTDLGGLSPVPGVYCFASTAQLTGTLTLTGSPTDVWIFQIGSSLTTASGASVVFAGGASPCNVFWQVGSSATIGVGNSFAGTIMALASITLNGGTLTGRALARNGSVTISSKENIINGCLGSSTTPTLVLSPINSSIICGDAASSITKTAVVLLNGVPVVGTTVTFTITGPDAGQNGTAVTDSSGTATFVIRAPSITSSTGDSIVATINGGTVVSNTAFATCSGSTSGAFCSTAPSPTIALVSVIPGPPKQVVLSAQSPGGLIFLFVNTPPTTNATVSIPSFDSGTTLAVGVTATKINQSASAVVELTATDLCGHRTVFDPVSATITIPASRFHPYSEKLNFNHPEVAGLAATESNFNHPGVARLAAAESKFNHREVAGSAAAVFNFNHWEGARFDGIGQTEGMVLLQNHTPGVDLLVIRVNGSVFTAHLSDGETKKIDISSALFHGANTVWVTASGAPRSSVDLTIYDGGK